MLKTDNKMLHIIYPFYLDVKDDTQQIGCFCYLITVQYVLLADLILELEDCFLVTAT